jgi:Homeodomain-like domain-containing protein
MLVELGVVEQRYRAVLEVLEEGLPVTEVARRYGVARQTVHEWLSRYAGGGLAGLAGWGHATAGPPTRPASPMSPAGSPGPAVGSAPRPLTCGATSPSTSSPAGWTPGCWPGCRCCTPTGCARPRD